MRIAALKSSLSADGLHRFDIFHAQDSIGANALAELCEEGLIHGFVRTVHHLDTFSNPRLMAWQRRGYLDADAVLCVSEMWAQKMAEDFGVQAVTVNNGVDLQRFCPSSTSQDDAQLADLDIVGDPVVLAMGGIEARKNTLQLLEAFALLRQTHVDARLVIAGGASLLDHDAYTLSFMTRAAELGLPVGHGKPVVVTGALNDAAIPALMRRADVVSMVSLREGFGLVVLEALATHTPVVVSQIAPFTGYLDERVCCWADPHDANSIAQALRCALVDRGGIDFERAVPALLQRFSWRQSALCHIALYRRHIQTVPREISFKGIAMPVMHFKVQWPDGSEDNCYSPSTVVGEFFVAGQRYALGDFVARAREALHIGSERVREKYGFACSAAMDQLAQIEEQARRFANDRQAEVKVIELL
jgi:glycosyltransferase-like protein/uncharacterized repeat protein (TIGR04042 family)